MNFEQYLSEAGGQAPGKMELLNISLDDALKYNAGKGFDTKKELPNFEKSFDIAQQLVKKGKTQRKDMPVIENEDIKKMQARLEKGYIDINKPFAKDTNPGKPFPEGLSGLKAKKFMENGIKDGNKNDDKIPVKIKQVALSDLKPIQKQIYYDKALGSTIDKNNKFYGGVDKSKDFVQNSFFVISKDNFIIDGHHRYLSGLIIDPKMKVNALSIDLPIKELLPLSLAFGDAIGNKRNK